jgi:hypothetical protein
LWGLLIENQADHNEVEGPRAATRLSDIPFRVLGGTSRLKP